MTVEGTRPLQLGQQARRLFLTHLAPEVGFPAASPCCSFFPPIFRLCPVLWEKVTHLSGEQNTCWAPGSSLLCRQDTGPRVSAGVSVYPLTELGPLGEECLCLVTVTEQGLMLCHPHCRCPGRQAAAHISPSFHSLFQCTSKFCWFHLQKVPQSVWADCLSLFTKKFISA